MDTLIVSLKAVCLRKTEIITEAWRTVTVNIILITPLQVCSSIPNHCDNVKDVSCNKNFIQKKPVEINLGIFISATYVISYNQNIKRLTHNGGNTAHNIWENGLFRWWICRWVSSKHYLVSVRYTNTYHFPGM